MNSRRSILVVVAALLMLAASFEPAFAQCAMCKEALANSVNGAAAAKQLNLGILVLLIPPVLMFAGIFGLIYRSGTKQDRTDR